MNLKAKFVKYIKQCAKTRPDTWPLQLSQAGQRNQKMIECMNGPMDAKTEAGHREKVVVVVVVVVSPGASGALKAPLEKNQGELGG